MAIRQAAAAVERVRVLAADRAVTGNGELAGLLELLATADACQAAVVELVDRIEAGSLAERRAGLPLEGLLALQSKATFGDRRFLHTVRDVLVCMPNVRAAFHAGALGWGQVRAIVCEAGPLTVALRAELDQRFADLDEIRRLQPTSWSTRCGSRPDGCVRTSNRPVVSGGSSGAICTCSPTSKVGCVAASRSRPPRGR